MSAGFAALAGAMGLDLSQHGEVMQEATALAAATPQVLAKSA